MSAQLALPLPDTLTCAFGVAHGLGQPCAACDAFGAEQHAAFLADVAAGVYDRWGYRPTDIKGPGYANHPSQGEAS